MPCKHNHWHVQCHIETFEHLVKRAAYLQIKCADCGKEFKPRGQYHSAPNNPAMMVFEIQPVDELVSSVVIAPGEGVLM